jgi:hypothetical protein
MKPFFVAILMLMLASCNADEVKVSDAVDDNNAGGEIMCKQPIEILYSKQKHTANGYIVSFEKSVDLEGISAEYLKKYKDLEIYTKFSSLNGFHGNSSNKTLQSLQCEKSVKSIQYNIYQSLDPKNEYE